MPTYDIIVKKTGTERYSIEAATPEEAMRKHEAGETTLKDNETDGVDGVSVIDRTTGLDVTPNDDLLPEEPVEKLYGVRLWATIRGMSEGAVTATSFEEAVAKASEFKHADFYFQPEEGRDIEGDETMIVYGPRDGSDEDDMWAGEGVEIEKREPGEPFSWVACALVREMAALHNMSNPTFVAEKFQDLIQRAAAACGKE